MPLINKARQIKKMVARKYNRRITMSQAKRISQNLDHLEASMREAEQSKEKTDG